MPSSLHQETLKEAKNNGVDVTVYTRSGHVFTGQVISCERQRCVLEMIKTSSSHGENKKTYPTLHLSDVEVVAPHG
jgi:small nuclear ribonucleoprotein (snRNP)-like protein